MHAQRLRYKVTIQARNTSINAYRENTGTWADVRQAWAAIEPWPDVAQRREAEVAGATQGQQTVRIVLRFEDGGDLTTAHRIVYGSTVYDIAATPVAEKGQRRMVAITCTRGLNQGGA